MIAALIKWFSAERWRMSASHAVELWVIWLPVYFLMDARSAALAVIVWYWSCKTCEHQFSIKNGASMATVWNKGWLPWEWSNWLILDLAIPALVACIPLFFGVK